MPDSSENLVHEVILDSVADGVFTVDQDWIITSFNRAAEQITGIPRGEAIGKKCFREFEPLGGTRAVKTDVRVIAATNRPLADLMARGVLREDLYYRLNVLRITLPALANRREDIPLLADHFLRQFSLRQGKTVDAISNEALGLLMRYDYPGNVRQLQNIIEHAVVICRGPRIEAECLPADLIGEMAARQASLPRNRRPPLIEAEARTILETLARFGGRRAKTAAALGIDTSTLWRKIKKYGITYP